MNGATNDPHILGFEEDTFDFMGKDSNWYCLYSGGTIVVNMLISSFPDTPAWTYVKAIAIMVGKEEVTKFYAGLVSDELNVTHNGEPIVGMVEFNTGLTHKLGDPYVGKAWVEGNTFVVQTGALDIRVTRDDKDEIMHNIVHLDTKLNAMELGLLSDGVQPHGVMGQTADWDGVPRRGTGLQGEGAIDGLYTDYELSGPFHTDFKFNRFGSEATVTPVYGKGFGYRSVVFM